MQLSDLLGLDVHDTGAHHLGSVIDVRLTLDDFPANRPSPSTIFGLVVSPRSRSAHLGFERTDARHPVLLAVISRWRHRGTFLALWQDIARVSEHDVTLRHGYTRYNPLLPDRD